MALWGRKQKDKIAHGDRRTSRQRRVRQRTPSVVPTYRKRLPSRGVRAFSAADLGRLSDGWTSSPVPIDEHIRSALQTLVARSRDIRMNTDLGRRVDELLQNGVIGPDGIVLQAQCGDYQRRDGAWSWELDDPANDALEQSWRRWGEVGLCDVTGTNGLVDIQAVGFSSMVLDGELLMRILRGRQFGPYGFQVQLLDPLYLDVNRSEDLGDRGYIRMGVEFNNWGRPVAYHIRDANTDGTYIDYAGNRYRRIPASDIIHSFLPEYVGQSRGIPWSANTMQRLQRLDAYENASLVNAEFGAAKVGTITETEDGASGMEPDQYDNDGNPELLADAGTFLRLRYGTTADILDTKYPDGEFADFTKAFRRGVASGGHVNYNELSNDYEGVNYTSLRHALLSTRDTYKKFQSVFSRRVLNRLYREWLSTQLLLDTIKISGRPLKASREEKYQRVRWQGRRWDWTDPIKEVTANKQAVDGRFKSTSEIIRASGRDPEEVYAEIAHDKAMWEKYGITPEMEGGAADFTDDGGDEEE